MLHFADMGHTFFSILWRDIRRYWWVGAGYVVWKLLEHWALAKTDEYIGSYIGIAVQRVNTFLHIDVATVVVLLVLFAMAVHAAIDSMHQAQPIDPLPALASPARRTFEIRFDYLPGNMLANGWIRAYPKDVEVKPQATLASDAPIAGSVVIDAPDGHAYDYQIPRTVKLSDRLVFAAIYTATTMIFTKVEMSSKDGTQTTQKWVKYEPGAGLPHPTAGHDDYECTFPIIGVPLQNGWRTFDISLPETVAQTWGVQGFIFRGITVLRLRGSLSISPIEFYESPK
jgi:hypothetical protein